MTDIRPHGLSDVNNYHVKSKNINKIRTYIPYAYIVKFTNNIVCLT